MIDADINNAIKHYNNWLADKTRPEPSDTDTTFFILDIDIFKIINDTSGHARGDSVLTQVSDVLKNHIHKDDYLVRRGGEEFLIVICHESRIQAPLLAEKNRLAFAEHKFTIDQDTTITRTCSI
ncbi:MAG: diguanylate cyclase (GGDEF)-like protein [Lentisphaeria bacterium]|jgi:diguanylate cyclase (GGDEF)-like protein